MFHSQSLMIPRSLPLIFKSYSPLIFGPFTQVRATSVTKIYDNERNRTSSLIIKSPKGSRDYSPAEMLVKQSICNSIIEVVKLYGAVEIETPQLELKEVLAGKYGEDSKFIYDLKDQGGEILSLRYDLTVPFARYVAMNKIGKIRKYQIGRVYRRDKPDMTKGRYREFYQLDYDVAGHYQFMLPDAECIQLIYQVLTKLNLEQFSIKVNHRKILDGVFGFCGVPVKKFHPLCSSVDKLDKMCWEKVRKEMVEERGLDESVADRIGEYVKLHGNEDLIHKLQKDQNLLESKDVQEGLKELLLLFEYCKWLGCGSNLVFDMGLTRGLDYYTGVVFEAVLTENDSKDGAVGSVAGGGRYDKLVGMLDSKNRSVPCVGVSFGIERLFAIQERKQKADEGKMNEDNRIIMATKSNITNEAQLNISQRNCTNAIVSQKTKISKPNTQRNETSTLILKTPKGTRDHNPKEMLVRRSVLNKFIEMFKMHEAGEIQTPVYELTEVLDRKYGEDSKLIYDLEEQEEEMLSMKYDLTVPFARYLATNKITNIKRYQIDTVHRRDNPSISTGRYREFYQCDFDIAGQYDSMVSDSECIQLIHQVLTKLNLGQFTIKVNHRRILDGVFGCCGVPVEKFRSICSSVDKLNKLCWEEVRKEMVEEKGLDESVADRIGEYVRLHDDEDPIYRLQRDQSLLESKNAQEGLKELLLLFEYCKCLRCDSNLVFDMGLARGLDYYTGVIFEAVLEENDSKDGAVGSVVGGGRYDKLVGMFDPKNRSVPCVGLSFGIERLFAIQVRKQKADEGKIMSTHSRVLVASPNKGLMLEVIALLVLLRREKIVAETRYQNKAKLLSQLQYAEENGIPLVLLVGKSELEEGVVKIRVTKTREEKTVKRKEMVENIKEQLSSFS